MVDPRGAYAAGLLASRDLGIRARTSAYSRGVASAVPRSRFRVPGSCSRFGFWVQGSRFWVLAFGTSNFELRTRDSKTEHEPGTWNVEHGTGGFHIQDFS